MNDRLLTHQMEQVLKTQVVSLLAFLYLNWTCRSFSQLPLDGIHDPLLFFSDPTMYEMTVLPICFSAIFTTKTLLTAHLQEKAQRRNFSCPTYMYGLAVSC